MTQTASPAVPYFDLKRQYESLSREFETALSQVASSGGYILSPVVAGFEQAFAEYCGTRFAVGVGSGTDALVLSMKASGIGPGDEVLVPSFTFSASVFSIMHTGATPVLVEVDPDTYTISPEAAEKAVTRKTRAILPVHLYGQAADMLKITSLAKKKKLKIFEDACQAHGASFNGKKTGSFGTAGSFSFYPTKNLGAMGDGGMITTNDAKMVETLHRLRNLGRKTVQENHLYAGYTSRLDAMQASILSIKLKHLDEFNDKRRKAAALYKSLLLDTPLVLPAEAPSRRHAYHLFVVRVPAGKRDALQKFLAGKNINTMIHYPIPVHKQPACKGKVKVPARIPVTEKICSEILSLPMFPEMTGDEVRTVCSAIRAFYGLS